MRAKRFSRVYRKYEDWEEIRFNMWGTVSNRKGSLDEAIKFTGNHKLYGKYMNRVIHEWPISCENALTDYSINRRAWVGHAACALALKIPEDITRQAWSKLTYEQQLLANKEAERAIQAWEYNYIKNIGICEDMESEMLPFRYP